MKKFILSIFISSLLISICNAQLRKDLDDLYNLSGPIVDTSMPTADQDLFLSSSYGEPLKPVIYTSLNNYHPQNFELGYNPVWTHLTPYKYDCTTGYDCMIGLNKNDNFPQVIGKLSVQYLIERILE